MRKSDLIEKLKGLYGKRNRPANGLGAYTMSALRQLIKTEEATWVCLACGGQLTVLKWNKEKDIITCNNSACNKYRTPVGTVRKSSEPLDEIKVKSKSKSKK